MELTVGDRIQCEGHRGTVRYVGEVPPTSGLWLGIEWDEPSRGKHDGIHNSVRYFQTTEPNAGSFVRLNKCEEQVEFCDALRERYLIQDDSCLTDPDMLRELQGMMKASLLEVVGMQKIGKKQSNLQELEIAVLDRMKIYSSGPRGKISQICPNIRELNLSGNLIKSWDVLATITIELQHLKILNISENRLTLPEDVESLRPAFSMLRELLMGSMNYTWNDIALCSRMWPQIESLSVPKNRITKLGSGFPTAMDNLRHLNLEGNAIENWEEVNSLGKLPRLESLSLYETGLKNISISSSDSFPSLQKLSLSNNRLSQWRHISELDKLPKLIDLKITGNPDLVAENHETKLQLVIARLSKLKVLNGSEISAEERRGAEVDYIKKYGTSYLSNLSDLTEFSKEHPRYNLLVQKYGPPEAGEMERKPVTLKSSLLNLRIVFEDSVEKKLPSTLTVQKLRTLCQRLFALDSSLEFSLYCRSSENSELLIPLDNDLRSLSFYSVEDKDEIIIKSN